MPPEQVAPDAAPPRPADALQHLPRPPARHGGRQVVQAPGDLQVVPAGEHLVNGGTLTGQADAGA
jgi:hypothetical protein